MRPRPSSIDVAGGDRAPVIGDLPDGFAAAPKACPSVCAVDGYDPDGDGLAFFCRQPAARRALRRAAPACSSGRRDTPGRRQVHRRASGASPTARNVVERTLDFIVQPANARAGARGRPDRTVREGDPIRIQLAGTDRDGNALTYTSAILPGRVDARPGHRRLRVDAGLRPKPASYDIPFVVSDGKLRRHDHVCASRCST